MRRIIRRLICKVFGHREVLTIGGHGLFVTCSRCWSLARDVAECEKDKLIVELREAMTANK